MTVVPLLVLVGFDGDACKVAFVRGSRAAGSVPLLSSEAFCQSALSPTMNTFGAALKFIADVPPDELAVIVERARVVVETV